MKQLSGLDAAFYHQDSIKTPMHVSPVLIYGPSTVGAKTLDLQVLEKIISHVVDEFDFLTHKLVDRSMGMDEPYWVYDKKFQLANHLHHSALPSPGDWRQLKSHVAQLHSLRLERDRPLWQLELITGLNNIDGIPAGSCAVLLKVHHAAIDGVSLANVVAALHAVDLESAQADVPSDEEVMAKGDNYDPFELWTKSSLKSWSRPLQLVKTMSRIVPSLVKAREQRQSPADELDSKVEHVKTRFNSEVSSSRVVGAVQLAVEDIQNIKRQVRRVTVNDVALAVVGGALRNYLRDKEELPEASMVSGVPINLRAREDDKAGNNISMMQVGLATDIEDPVERLRAIHEYALIGKARTKLLGERSLMDVSDSLAPALLAESLRMLSFASMASDLPVPFHVIVSNVPGTPRPMSLSDSPLLLLLGLGPLRHNMGLFHIVTQVEGAFTISFTSCRTMMPDPETYEAYLEGSFEALIQSSRRLSSQ